MFKEKLQNIVIREDSIMVGERHLLWSDILGIRKYTSPIFYQLSTSLPSVSLFLKGGRVVRIYKKINLSGVSTMGFEDKFKQRFKELFTVIREIEARAMNMRRNISRWIEWRVFVIALIVEPIIYIFVLIADPKHDVFGISHTYALIGGVISIIFGMIWEFYARKNHWQ